MASAAMARDSQTSAAVSGDPLPSNRARLIDSISWRDGTNGLRILVDGDGPVSPGQIRIVRLGGDNPRDLLIIRGIGAPYRENAIAFNVGGVRRLRTGFHEKGSGNELHMVFDLESTRVPAPNLSYSNGTLEVNYPPP